MRSIATVGALLAIVALVGCGGKTTKVGDTTITTSDDNKTTSVTTADGSAKVGAGAVDASKLGAPVYPGATAADSGSISLSTADSSIDSETLTTPDSFDKVYEYYKGQLPAGSEKMKMTVSSGSTAMFQTGDADKDAVTVTISSKDGDNATSVNISHTVKKVSASPAGS